MTVKPTTVMSVRINIQAIVKSVYIRPDVITNKEKKRMTDNIPRIEGDACFHFTCLDKPTAYDPMIMGRKIPMYVPVCAYHKSLGGQSGKTGFLTLAEVKWFKRFERIIRFFGRRAERRGVK